MIPYAKYKMMTTTRTTSCIPCIIQRLRSVLHHRIFQLLYTSLFATRSHSTYYKNRNRPYPIQALVYVSETTFKFCLISWIICLCFLKRAF